MAVSTALYVGAAVELVVLVLATSVGTSVLLEL